MQDISFRQAKSSDHEVVVDLMQELVNELDPLEDASGIKIRISQDIQKALNSENICIFLATREDSVIGFSRGDILFEDPIFRLRADNRCGYVDQMFVNPNYRGNKIGEKLLALCESWFRSKGIRYSILHAAVRATRFYARSGYQSNREMFKKL